MLPQGVSLPRIIITNLSSQDIGTLLTEPPSQLTNAGIALPPVKGMCYCLSLSTKALIHNWLPEPGGLEGSTNYGVDCSKTLPPSKDGESSSNLIPFHSATEHRVDLKPVCKLEFLGCGPVENKHN